MHYYNEHDPFAANWLRGLIAAGLIPAGDVDERSIEDVTANDVAIYTSCHWFAGIGGWPYALRLAGWPDDRPVWTGSAPCQPFSAAGKGGGFADERHLWPAWFWIIRQCQPPAIFGEQVSSAAGLAWFDVVSSDLEAAGYAVGAADLCAASVGAPHIRQRLYFVADRIGVRYSRLQRASATGVVRHGEDSGAWPRLKCRDADGGLADATNKRHDGRRAGKTSSRGNEAWQQSERFCDAGSLGNPGGAGLAQRQSVRGNNEQEFAPTQRTGRDIWSDLEWFPCLDGKARPTQPGLFPLAHGVPARVGRLRGYGNAIVPPLAAEFIAAYMEARR